MFRKFLLVGVLGVSIAGLALIAMVLPIRAANLSTNQQPQPNLHDALPAFEARLSGAEEVPAVTTEANGRAVMVLNADTSTLHYRVVISDITNVTGAHIHVGQPGEEGDVVFPLYDPNTTPFDPQHPISGTLVLEHSQISDLLLGRYYVNVHTQAHPEGEIRGQLRMFNPDRDYHVQLSGAQETPPVQTNARGEAHLMLHPRHTQVDYHITVTDIMSITAAHFHTGWPGEAGPPVITLYDGSGVFDPQNPLSGTAELSAQNLLDFLTGYLYVNVHTEAYPEGEIRGQVGAGAQDEGRQYSVFRARLSGRHEVPPVVTQAFGRSTMVLDEEQKQLYYRVRVWNIEDIIGAHIHLGAPGEEGGIVFPLYDPNTTPFDPQNPISGTLTLNDNQISDLKAGLYYVNVHTTAYPDGEIRGQLLQFPPRPKFRIPLTGERTGSSGSGFVEFNFADRPSTLQFFIQVQDVSGVTAVNLRSGNPEQSGQVIVPLYEGEGDLSQGVTGETHLTARDFLDLLSGELYIAVETEAYPEGELVGQVQDLVPSLFFPLIP